MEWCSDQVALLRLPRLNTTLTGEFGSICGEIRTRLKRRQLQRATGNKQYIYVRRAPFQSAQTNIQHESLSAKGYAPANVLMLTRDAVVVCIVPHIVMVDLCSRPLRPLSTFLLPVDGPPSLCLRFLPTPVVLAEAWAPAAWSQSSSALGTRELERSRGNYPPAPALSRLTVVTLHY
jgi:hypothetical protein